MTGTLHDHEHRKEEQVMWLALVNGWVRVATVLALVGRRLAAPQRAAVMIEYAIVAALIAMVAMAAVQALGGGIVGVFQGILGHLPRA